MGADHGVCNEQEEAAEQCETGQHGEYEREEAHHAYLRSRRNARRTEGRHMSFMNSRAGHFVEGINGSNVVVRD
jgi:hypothetical protein